MKNYNPERGFFNGKLSRYALVVATVLAVSLPATIKADVEAQKLPAVAGITRSTWITAYASVPEQTSSHPFITASGQLVRDGIIAANFLPFGTRVQIPALFGDKVFVVTDRMAKRFSQRVDVWMPTVDASVNFGIHKAEIVILGPSDDSADATLAAAN
jgi:3D (Asp-Asp-Asp) domain-containing protein